MEFIIKNFNIFLFVIFFGMKDVYKILYIHKKLLQSKYKLLLGLYKKCMQINKKKMEKLTL